MSPPPTDSAPQNTQWLQQEASQLRSRYAAFRSEGLSLDMTRGKPSGEQLDLSLGMLTVLGPDDYRAADGTDCRNYGGLDGLAECKGLFADFMGVGSAEVLIGDNSSLALMHDTVARALSHGVVGSRSPWSAGPVRFLCPCPGYDRHFSVCEHFGIEMLVVEMREDGPDMDRVEQLTASDPTIKGMWVVPKYSNPTGAVVSADVARRMARMPTAAADFRIFWDNAYAHHDLTDDPPAVADLLGECKSAGNADRALMYGSTSKISFAGAGIAVMAASEANIAWMRKHRSFQTIGPDKLNQLRHVRFFKDLDGVRAHMRQHAELIRPKFDTVLKVLDAELGGSGLATWTRPQGGYFISLDVPPGCARTVVRLASEAGVKLTSAGATFPYGKDPNDCNIRIAPTLPSVADIEKAMAVLCTCVQLAALGDASTS